MKYFKHNQLLKKFLFLFPVFILLQMVCLNASEVKNLYYPHTIIGISSDQSFPNFIKDDEMSSPKSVQFSLNDTSFYIQALEGSKTLVYSFPKIRKVNSIKHHFDSKVQDFYSNNYRNHFFKYPDASIDWNGKPVEAVLDESRGLLYVSSYRRDNDNRVIFGSTLSIIDTSTNKMIGSLPTSSIPKVLSLSNDKNLLSVTNWGDNSITIWDVSSAPNKIKLKNHIQVASEIDQKRIEPSDKDSSCGFCLRGTTFTNDDKFIMISGMKSGGVLFMLDTTTSKISKINVPFLPIRHIVASKKLKKYFFSTTGEGSICTVTENGIKDGLKNGLINKNDIQCRKTNSPIRTIDISEENGIGVATMNQSCEISIFKLDTLQELQKLPAPCYPVGLTFSSNGNAIIVTAQGKQGEGGHKVGIYYKKQ